MRDSYPTPKKLASPVCPLSSSEIIGQQAAAHACDMQRLDDLAAVFLTAADGDPVEAERQLDTTVDLLLEGGVLSIWRYRILLGEIRESGAVR